MIADLFILAAGVALAQQAPQQPAPPQPTVQQQRQAIWDRDESPLPMDAPPLSWFPYNKDSRGRPTYLSPACITTVQDRFIATGELYDVCMPTEANAHKQAIADHAAEVAAKEKAAAEAAQRAQAEAAERARRAYEASPAGQAALRAKQTEARAAQAQVRTEALASRENQIRSVRSNQLYMEQFIADEKNASRVTGYMHYDSVQSAAIIVQRDQRQIQALYADYRAAGGRKSLAQIYAGAQVRASPPRQIFSNVPDK